MLLYALFGFAIVWLLAVYKVFVLDDGVEIPNAQVDAATLTKNVYEITSRMKFPSKESVEKFIYVSDKDGAGEEDDGKAAHVKVPLASEWLFVRSDPGYKPESYERSNYQLLKNDPSSRDVVSSTNSFGSSASAQNADQLGGSSVKTADLGGSGVIPATELKWPPVNLDGSIPPNEGFDVLPVTNLEVPRFWEASPGVDLNKAGRMVNGHETIFLMIASYRDFQCRETITSAFMRSDHPERLFVGAVDQTVPGDIGCLDIDIPCSQDATQPICKYRDQIAVFHMDAKLASGPVTARHVGDRMFRGEFFVMQMDAHCLFVNHWDTFIIQQWRDTHNEMAVLSSYLTDVQGSIDANGDSTRKTRPIMCNSEFEGMMPARYLRHMAQPECMAEVQDMPQLSPFWAAGFSFSRGHFKVRVPYDGYQPMVFQGEEIAIGVRGFTHGYDYYAPKDSVVFHEYAVKSSRRSKVHMFWENSPQHKGEGQKSLRRSTAVIGMAPDIDPATWDHRELEKYGIGNVRSLELFYKIFLIDTHARTSVMLCPFVKTGLMHRAFTPYLRADGLGIDYSYLENYDTMKAIEEQLFRQHPLVEQALRSAINRKSKQSLQEAIKEGERVMLAKKNPELLQQARIALQTASF